MRYINSYQTEIGPLSIAEQDGAVINLIFGEVKTEGYIVKETPLIKRAIDELEEYLKGERKEFSIPLNASGTEFQRGVWHELCEIPYGQTRTYGQVAAAIGNPKACRAVGLANNRNPIAIFIPCHRVIGSDNSLTGYAGGLDIKKKLLAVEKENV